MANINIDTREIERLILTADVDDRTRTLWHRVFTQAIEDRARMLEMFESLRDEMATSTTGHAIYGQLVARYAERISKSTDQLQKLVEHMHSVFTRADEITPTDVEDIFDRIEKDACLPNVSSAEDDDARPEEVDR